MSIAYDNGKVVAHHGDCLDVLAEMPDMSIDAIVTDPPYGLGFMGKEWDDLPPGEPWARECLRVLKPGGHLLAFGGTRTWHRLAVAIEDAGFEMRDSIAWMYGNGFPKSLDVAKAIDNAAGATREVVGIDADKVQRKPSGSTGTLFLGGFTTVAQLEAAAERGERTPDGQDAATTLRRYHANKAKMGEITVPVTPAAQQWQGWGTALKPAFEPIVVARKPLAAGTVAANVLAHGTGGLNIDATRVGTDVVGWGGDGRTGDSVTAGASRGGTSGGYNYADGEARPAAGRWPANVLLDGSQADTLDAQTGTSVSRIGKPRGTAAGDGWGMTTTGAEYADDGGASRFFPTFRYEAKAPQSERPHDGATAHPTVKPLDLMRWLVRLVTPPGGTVLDPFAGSGTTAEACVIEGFRCVGIEREANYIPLIVNRLNRRLNPAAYLAGNRNDDDPDDLLSLLDGGAA